MNDTPTKPGTRASLIAAGLSLFGHKGFDGTSTRDLAALAKTNVASISYHFGSKQGLREACAMDVVDRVSRALDRALSIPTDGLSAIETIERLIRALVDQIVGAPESADMVAFMLREITEPGEIADEIYQRFIEPRHQLLCMLWSKATGRDPQDIDVKLAVFALVGQVLYFRIAAPFVLRRMSWTTLGPDEKQRIADLVIENLHSTIERQKT